MRCGANRNGQDVGLNGIPDIRTKEYKDFVRRYL